MFFEKKMPQLSQFFFEKVTHNNFDDKLIFKILNTACKTDFAIKNFKKS